MADAHINPATGVWDDNYYSQTQGGGGGDPYAAIRGISVPASNFNYDQAEQTALAKLAPYYKQQLDLHNGDVESAKKAIETDYQSGVRYRGGEYGGQMTQENQTSQDEWKGMLDELNKRGVLFQETAPGQTQNVPQAAGQEPQAPTGMNNAGVTTQAPQPTTPQQGLGYSNLAAQQTMNPLLDKQQQRRMAIQRAMQRQNEVADTQHTRDTESQGYAQKSYADTLAKQQQGEAQGMVMNDQNSAYQKYQNTVTRSAQPSLTQ